MELFSHLFFQQLAVDEPRFAVNEAASRAGVDVAGRQDGHHVVILPGLCGDKLEQSWEKRHTLVCAYVPRTHQNLFVDPITLQLYDSITVEVSTVLGSFTQVCITSTSVFLCDVNKRYYGTEVLHAFCRDVTI